MTIQEQEEMVELFVKAAYDQNPGLGPEQKASIEELARTKLQCAGGFANKQATLENMADFVMAIVQGQTNYGPNKLNSLKLGWLRYSDPLGSTDLEQAARFLSAAADNIHGGTRVGSLVLKKVMDAKPAPETVWEVLCAFPFALK